MMIEVATSWFLKLVSSHGVTFQFYSMSFNKDDRKEFEKFAQSKGYSWNSDGSKLTNGNNNATYSASGGSVNVGGTKYTSLSDAKNSKKW